MSDKEQRPMRPDPIRRIDTNFFWDACERGEFVAQKCGPCDKLWHPPRPLCPQCHSLDKSVQRLTGKGTVLSWARQARPASFGFRESPYVILVELEEGIRMLSNLEGDVPPEYGMSVRVDFAKTSGGKAVPVFRPAEAV
jgi:uncharacterized OB-fold protein